MPTTELDPSILAEPEAFLERFPYEVFAHLRANDPVALVEDRIQGVPFWAITKHADVQEVSRQPEIFSSHVMTSNFKEPVDEQMLLEQQMILVNQDPPDHTRLRSIVNKGFTPRMVARLEGRIREFCEIILDRAIAAGTCDFVEMVSAELPLEVIAEVMGAPLEDRKLIFDLSNRLIGFDDPEFQDGIEDARTAAGEMYMYSDALRLERIGDPKDDIVTRLTEAEVDGHKLSDLEFNLFFLLLAVAGNETTRNSLTHGMLAFLDNPDQWELLKANPELAGSAADEVIRWGHPVIQFRRTATQDYVLRGRTIKAGDKVVVYYASANRDEDVFENPTKFDITRDPNPHLSFGGGGPHFCLGSHLAKLEIKVMLETMIERMPGLRRTEPEERLQSNFINGIKRMPVEFVAKA